MDAIPQSHHDNGSNWTGGMRARPAQTDLDRAVTLIAGWLGCTAEQAFDALFALAFQHRLPTLRLAEELVIMANGDPTESTRYRTAVTARWGGYLPKHSP